VFTPGALLPISGGSKPRAGILAEPPGVVRGRLQVTEHGEGTLRSMAAGWPFFANLLADVEMVLAKADLGIASRYATLANDDVRLVFTIISEELDRTCREVWRLRGGCDLLESFAAPSGSGTPTSIR